MKVGSAITAAIFLCMAFLGPIHARFKKPKYCVGLDGKHYLRGEDYDDKEACIRYTCVRKGKNLKMNKKKIECEKEPASGLTEKVTALENKFQDLQNNMESILQMISSMRNTSRQLQLNMTSNSNAINNNKEDISRNENTITTNNAVLAAKDTEMKNCLADITSSDCPTPTGGKTSVAGGISDNTAALADKCDDSTCSDIQTSAAELELNMTSNVNAINNNKEAISSNEDSITTNNAALAARDTKIESCLADITSSDCPTPAGGKTSVAGGISDNTAALADKCDESTCSAIQTTSAELETCLGDVTLGCPSSEKPNGCYMKGECNNYKQDWLVERIDSWGCANLTSCTNIDACKRRPKTLFEFCENSQDQPFRASFIKDGVETTFVYPEDFCSNVFVKFIIRDSTTNDAIENATTILTFLEDEISSGRFNTSSDGEIFFPINENGEYMVQVAAEDYLNFSTSFTMECALAQCNLCNKTVPISLSPMIQQGEAHVFINWAEKPSDLDIHVSQFNSSLQVNSTSNSNTSATPDCHVFYSDKICGGLILDVDNTNGGDNGAETVTFNVTVQTNEFVYLVYVDNYSPPHNHLGDSELRLTIVSTSGTLIEEMDKTDYNAERYWIAGCLRFDGNRLEWRAKNEFVSLNPHENSGNLCIVEFQ